MNLQTRHTDRDSRQESEPSSDSVDGLTEAILNWIGTFSAEIGPDAQADNLQVLGDGVILM